LIKLPYVLACLRSSQEAAISRSSPGSSPSPKQIYDMYGEDGLKMGGGEAPPEGPGGTGGMGGFPEGFACFARGGGGGGRGGGRGGGGQFHFGGFSDPADIFAQVGLTFMEEWERD